LTPSLLTPFEGLDEEDGVEGGDEEACGTGLWGTLGETTLDAAGAGAGAEGGGLPCGVRKSAAAFAGICDGAAADADAGAGAGGEGVT
jgi:hypothetical protein